MFCKTIEDVEEMAKSRLEQLSFSDLNVLLSNNENDFIKSFPNRDSNIENYNRISIEGKWIREVILKKSRYVFAREEQKIVDSLKLK